MSKNQLTWSCCTKSVVCLMASAMILSVASAKVCETASYVSCTASSAWLLFLLSWCERREKALRKAAVPWCEWPILLARRWRDTVCLSIDCTVKIISLVSDPYCKAKKPRRCWCDCVSMQLCKQFMKLKGGCTLNQAFPLCSALQPCQVHKSHSIYVKNGQTKRYGKDTYRRCTCLITLRQKK